MEWLSLTEYKINKLAQELTSPEQTELNYVKPPDRDKAFVFRIGYNQTKSDEVRY
jgi:hypothetical protein